MCQNRKNNVEQIVKMKLHFSGRINIGLIEHCDQNEILQICK